MFERLFGGTIEHPVKYIICALIFGLVIRIILCFFKRLEVRREEARVTFLRIFLSRSYDLNIDDYWLNFFIGVGELMIFPLLMLAKEWTIIGAWLGLKTAVHWQRWSLNRTPYNRYLLGTILVIIFSACLINFWTVLKCG